MGIKCLKCQFENPDDTVFCGKCATRLPSPGKAEVKKNPRDTQRRTDHRFHICNHKKRPEDIPNPIN